MNFTDLPGTVKALIASHPLFAPDAASVLFLDVGDARPGMDAQLDISTTPPGHGYAVAVWPPAKGESNGEELSGAAGTDSTVVVRIEANPKMLTALNASTGDADAAVKWLTTRIQAIIGAVISLGAEVGGVRFRVSREAFELANFDEGMVAFHIRFVCFSVFSLDAGLALPPIPAFVPPKTFVMTDSVTGNPVTVSIRDGEIVLDF